MRAFSWIHEHRHEHNVRVVSNSWGREKDDAHYDEDDPVIRASDALVSDGLVLVFSAGNRGRDGQATLTTEATNPNVITVGAASAAGRAEPYSSRGPAVDGKGNRLDWVKPDVMAPGTGVLSTRANAATFQGARSEEDQHYTTMNGTSMAAPHVASAAALLLDAHPDLAPATVAAILTGTARDIGAPGVDPDTGHGMLSVAAALDAAHLMEGGEQRVVTERRVPVHASGTVTAAPEAVLVNRGSPSLPPAKTIAVPLPLPEHAVQVDLWFNWTGPGDFEVALVGPGGATAFERVTGASLRLERPATEGEYRIEARPLGVSPHATYEVTGSVLLREARDVEAPAELHARGTYSNGGFFVPQTTSGRVLGVLAAAPGLVLAFVGAGAATAALAWRSRRSA